MAASERLSTSDVAKLLNRFSAANYPEDVTDVLQDYFNHHDAESDDVMNFANTCGR